jgi:hypothetical protein
MHVLIFIQNEAVVDTKAKKALAHYMFQRYESLEKANRSDGKTYEMQKKVQVQACHTLHLLY